MEDEGSEVREEGWRMFSQVYLMTRRHDYLITTLQRMLKRVIMIARQVEWARKRFYRKWYKRQFSSQRALHYATGQRIFLAPGFGAGPGRGWGVFHIR